jgi:hypothetical protein
MKKTVGIIAAFTLLFGSPSLYAAETLPHAVLLSPAQGDNANGGARRGGYIPEAAAGAGAASTANAAGVVTKTVVGVAVLLLLLGIVFGSSSGSSGNPGPPQTT